MKICYRSSVAKWMLVRRSDAKPIREVIERIAENPEFVLERCDPPDQMAVVYCFALDGWIIRLALHDAADLLEVYSIESIGDP